MKPTAIYFGHQEALEQSEEVEQILQESFELIFAQHFTFNDQERFSQELLSKFRADFLFSFGPLIVKPVLLDSIRMAAINFHPATPRWPGRGSCSMAILNGDSEFGVTSHIMQRKVDAGPILKVIRFPILTNDDAATLREMSFSYIPKLAQQVVNDLEQNDWKPTPSEDAWERKAIRKTDALAMLKIAEVDSMETIRRKKKASVTANDYAPTFATQASTRLLVGAAR